VIESEGILKPGWMSESIGSADWGMSDAEAMFWGFA
jgi:hypothetical protein